VWTVSSRRTLGRGVLWLVVLCALASCAPASTIRGDVKPGSSEWSSSASIVAGHPLRIHLRSDGSSESLAGLASSAVREVQRRIAPTGEGSLLAGVNREAGRSPVKVPEDLRVLVRRALAFYLLTDGAVDITDGPLRGLWDSGESPSSESVRAAMARRGSDVISVDELEGSLSVQRAGVTLDLDTMGRAYAVAVAGQRLETAGADRYRIDYGELSVLGEDPGKMWKLPLPDGPGTPPRARRWLRVAGGAVSVVERSDGRVGPLLDVIDPRTGSPTRSLSYALVVSSDPVQSAAIARGLAILGRTRGLEIIETLEGVEGLVIDLAGYIHASSGLRTALLQEPLGDGPAP